MEKLGVSMSNYLAEEIFGSDILMEPTRKGFGEGLLEAGKNDSEIVALSADLVESTQVEPFAKEFPDRFVEMGVAEQNLVTVASGMAAIGKKPFVTSYASFSPGRNWEQIRTTICLNDRPVRVVGCHSGVSVGPDGATHQMLEDIALMRALPNMIVVVPADSLQAKKATEELAKIDKPSYLRLTREKTAVFTSENSEFKIGKAEVLKEGDDLTIVACGPLVYEALKAARELNNIGKSVEVINCHTIKPIDSKTIIKSAKKNGLVFTLEEAQTTAGLGGAVSELLSEHQPTKIIRLGVRDRFGQSGTISELWKEYQLDSASVVKSVTEVIKV
jgi:transketolase